MIWFGGFNLIDTFRSALLYSTGEERVLKDSETNRKELEQCKAPFFLTKSGQGNPSQ